MSSTNKTTNYELSQFLGTDKPAWLTDYNADMGKIDAQMKLNADAATSAGGTASAASTAIGNLASLTTTDKASVVNAINEVKSDAGTAQTTASTANNTAAGADTKATNALAGLAKFDLGEEVTLTVTSNVGRVLNNSLKIRKDSTGSVYKLYGQIDVDNLTNVSGTITLTITTDSGLRPAASYDVNCAGLLVLTGPSGQSMGARKFSVGTDGTITIPADTLDGGVSIASWIFWPALYFNTSFGD